MLVGHTRVGDGNCVEEQRGYCGDEVYFYPTKG